MADAKNLLQHMFNAAADARCLLWEKENGIKEMKEQLNELVGLLGQSEAGKKATEKQQKLREQTVAIACGSSPSLNGNVKNFAADGMNCQLSLMSLPAQKQLKSTAGTADGSLTHSGSFLQDHQWKMMQAGQLSTKKKWQKHWRLSFYMLIVILSLPSLTNSLTPPTPPPVSYCNGVHLQYTLTRINQLSPNEHYPFESTAMILNNGLEDLISWKLFIDFQHKEYLIFCTNAMLLDGTTLPADTTTNELVFSGFPTTDLKSANETQGDVEQMSVTISFVGTELGVKPPNAPMPRSISLLNDGFNCSESRMLGKGTMYACCLKEPDFVTTVTMGQYQPRKKGDLVIFYDIVRSFDSEYDAQVSIQNYNSLGRLDNWKLSWTWMGDEFIKNMRGAYPSTVGSGDCIFGPQGTFYKDMNLSNVLNCQRNPTFVDLPRAKTYDSTLGMIPFCCRDGTILPPSMNPSKSISMFQLQVQKMPPFLNRTVLVPPHNFQIKGSTFNPDFKCGPPIFVTPSLFRHPSGLPVNETAVASWQIACNIAPAEEAIPKCCVSLSAFYNESVIPCQTCACGCDRPSSTCNANAPANLLPPDALPVPFDNQTDMAIAWARSKHLQYSRPEPCPDFCGVSIHWHLKSNHSKGWSARITVFNWGETNFADWVWKVQITL
ncbi:COBRA-like protein 7 isoform X2 [Papaver somniferum]|uniref:COBRA-like protein 7 isoform X2 n=1 Tax=Papaver somniferum TaxID=3469 RepID=UPI000E6F7D6E|nr:COBRA-like protein 7 isoform X2 [Papaver somniferum]